MSNVKKIDLARFKKTMSGLIEFATLIEQASPTRRAKILTETENIDRHFLKKVMRKVVFFEEIIYLDDGILADILSKISYRQIAFALKKSSPEFKKNVLKHLSYSGMKQTMDESEQIKNDVPEEFVLGAQKQILFIARTLEKQNRFTFELSDCPRFREETLRKIRRS